MSDGEAVPDVGALLDELGFDPDESVLTERQAEVLVLRERDIQQRTIADHLGTSRANVSSVEASARDNVRAARETVEFARALSAPVRLTIGSGTDLYNVPDRVFSACDEADLKVKRTAPELMKTVSDGAGDAVQGREVRRDITVTVTADGAVTVRSASEP